MNTVLDNSGRLAKPYMTLCNPNGDELLSLGNAYDMVNTLRFNALSELTFRFPMSVDNGNTILDGYELLKSKRLIFLENSGYYIITTVDEDLDGTSPIKKVSCTSIDGELINKKLLVFAYTSIKFYDFIDPAETLLYKILEYIPSWSIGDVDTELTTKYRSFDVSDTTIFNFLMEDVEEAYQCVFFFDYDTKTISVKTVDNATTETDIFFSFDNLIQKASFTELSDEITTVLYVYGGDGLDIRSVNPLGTNAIYDFSYYKTEAWMSTSLISSLSAWESLVDSRQSDYADGLALLRTAYDNKYVYESELDVLENELSAQDTLLATAVQTNQDRTAILAEIASLNSQILSKQAQVDGEQSSIDAQISYLSDITDELSFANNFTDEEYSELSRYFYENTYQNENIIRLDSMSPAQIQDQAQELYDQSAGVLEKLSQPRYEFSLDSVNFIGIEEFSSFTDELELGCTVFAQLKNDTTVEAILLEMDINYDNLGFTLTFGNRLRLDGATFVYADILGSVKRTGSDVSFNSETWSNWDRYYKDNVSTFITSSLDASTNKVINASDQSFVIDQTGLRGRKADGSTYDDKQVWVTNNVLAFTGDGWATSSLAIGEIDLPSGGTGYGVVGNTIIGTILAGNSLTITSEDSSFTLDENGAVLQNASFTVIKDGTTISINPSDGISINKDGVDTFYVDVDGNLKAGGFSITGTQIYKDSTHYLDSANNVLRWGDLEVDGDTLTVTNLQGSLDWNNLTNVPAANVAYGGSNGYLSGSGVYGGALSGAGGTSIELDSFGVLTMKTNLSVRIQDGTSAGFRVENGNGICDANGGFLSGNGIWSGGDIEANGNIYMSSGSLVATRNWVTSNYSPIGHTHSQYYESGDSPSFYRVTASNDYNIGSYSGLGSATDLRTLTFYDRDGNYHYIYVRGGLITTMG